MAETRAQGPPPSQQPAGWSSPVKAAATLPGGTVGPRRASVQARETPEGPGIPIRVLSQGAANFQGERKSPDAQFGSEFA